MSEDDIATFLTSQTMVDGIVLATDTGSCHKLQRKVISEADSIVEHLLVQDKPVLGKWQLRSFMADRELWAETVRTSSS